jgi:hypothetical protein
MEQTTSSGGMQPGQGVSYWEDYVDILYAPADVFARRENGNFWIPLLVVTVFFAMLWMASVRVLEPVFDAEWGRQMERLIERHPQMSPEALEAQREPIRNMQVVLAAVIVPLTIFVVGFVLWAVGKVFEAKQTLRSALVVAAFAYIPRVLEQGVAIAEGFIRDVEAIDGRNRLTWGVGRFMDPEIISPQLLAVVSRLDVFTIWVTVLLAIGLAVTGRISRQRAAAAGVVMWLIGAIPTYFAMLTQE